MYNTMSYLLSIVQHNRIQIVHVILSNSVLLSAGTISLNVNHPLKDCNTLFKLHVNMSTADGKIDNIMQHLNFNDYTYLVAKVHV